jgi:hypothetical protein
MTGQTEPIGYLFESISIYEPSAVSKFIEKMSPEQAFYVLTQAVQMAYTKNLYTMQESEILSKAIRVLSQSENEETPTE